MLVIKNNRNKQRPKIIKYSKIESVPYPMKPWYYMVIPPNIFQTWHTKVLPPLMYKAVNKLRRVNPRFTYNLYDDNDCREFIKNNFDENVLNTYNKLIPGAYKADLWRYCILFKYGGIYIDIKYKPVNNFKLINLTENEHWVKDMDNNGIYNAIIVSKPNNPILLRAINDIISNAQNNYYGNNSLDVTGPGLLSQYFTREEKDAFDMRHDLILDSLNNRVIYYNNYIILSSYNGYLEESSMFKKVEHYSILWANRHIYN